LSLLERVRDERLEEKVTKDEISGRIEALFAFEKKDEIFYCHAHNLIIYILN
jgi:hypothetical protein